MNKEAKKIKVTYYKSFSGYKQDQKDTIKMLGFKKLGETKELTDSKTLRGMLLKVQHLVKVSQA